MSSEQGPTASPAPTPPARPPFLAIFPSIMLPMFLAVVDQTIVATALPAIAAATGNVTRAAWIVVSYLIASTIAAPVYGRLGDAFGRRRLMFVALFIFILASLLCAASPTVELLEQQGEPPAQGLDFVGKRSLRLAAEHRVAAEH